MPFDILSFGLWFVVICGGGDGMIATFGIEMRWDTTINWCDNDQLTPKKEFFVIGFVVSYFLEHIKP